MKFIQWLYGCMGEDSPVGDLARDVRMDKDWPKKSNSKNTFVRHLKEVGAVDAAVEALQVAWQRYIKEEEEESKG
jgi:uncharacterized protein YozE (UPF0346 family)